MAQRVYLQFPRALERALAPYDDPPIAIAQRLWTSTLVRIAVLAVTVVTAVEAALPIPAALYALGYDAHAGLATSVLIVLALASQLPKKFIFRPRPWIAGRAVSFRKDTTSSFPSRAVVCSVVFSWLAIMCLRLDPSNSAGTAMMPTSLVQGIFLWSVVGLSAGMAAFARIIVGAHYPSDTVCGFFLGLVVIRLGVQLEQLWPYLGCSAVSPTSTSSAVASHAALILSSSESVGQASEVLKSTVITSARSLLYLTPHTRLIAATTMSYLLTIVSIKGFWVKCSYVYGLLLSAATFRVVFLCPMATGVAVGALRTHGGPRQHVAVTALFGTWLAFGMATRAMKGNVRIVLFTVIYFGVLTSTLLFRL
jgi:membrane-associated phospholipid phosphatase